MLFSLVTTTIVLVSLLIATSAWSLIRNYAIARKIGLPIIVVPFSHENPIWMLTARHVMPLVKYIPVGNGHFTRFGYTGFQFHDKYHMHQELGDGVVIVTPGKNWIYVCNADAIHDVIRRERQGEFARPVELLAMLDVFGPNLSTVSATSFGLSSINGAGIDADSMQTNGADWQRQRKCTATSFNEQTNALVWYESLRQGQQLLEHWRNADARKSSTLAQDTKTLTLDVLVRAAFGKSFDFHNAQDKTTTLGPLSYRDALAIVLENAILILALGPDTLKRLSFIPGLSRVSDAANQFRKYMSDMFDEHSEATAQKQQPAQGNLITSLVCASVEYKLLSRDEVIGNMFVYNFAGHDTTAHSFAFTFMLLAANPEVQEWMVEEINYVVTDKQTSETQYNLYPRLVRTLAVLVRFLSPTSF